MDGEEYEVESVTRARVHDKRGKKITWRYYVKWKGYDWNDSTWEPTDSFQGGSEHILEAFWERIDTNGRDISDASSFKKGEELFISGPPGKKGLKRKANGSNAEAPPPSEINTAANPVSISAPLPNPGKRRRTQVASDEEDDTEASKPKRQAKTAIAPPRPNRRASMGGQKKVEVSVKAPKRRRASSPGLRKQAPKRMPSAGDSQLDADGETDPDAIEVEDELMLVSGEDVEDGAASRGPPATTSARANGLKNIVFDDLEPFYSGNPIDIDQPADESVQDQKPAAEARSQTPPSASPSPERHPSEPQVPEDNIPESQGPEHHTPEFQVPDSPPRGTPDPLFDSPSRFSERPQETRRESPLPFHRARAAKPLVKLIDPPTTENKGTQSRITAKARLMSLPKTSTGGPSGQTARRSGKPGPGRSSAGMVAKNRSSLLTATKGILQSVKGKFATTNAERNQPEEIEEEVPVDASEERRFAITSWSDESNTAVPLPQSSAAPTAEQSLTLAALQKHGEELSDYEEDDDAVTRFNITEEREGSSTLAIAGDKLSGEASSHAAEVHQPGDQPRESTPTIAEPKSQESNTIVADELVSSVGTRPFEELIRKNIELAKEQLFPSTGPSLITFSDTGGSFKSTIFGPLYQGIAVGHSPIAENEASSTFRLIVNDKVELPLVLKDRNQLKVRISDITMNKSSSGKRALFYRPDDAAAIVDTLKSGGTARVVLDASAELTQKERFTTLLERFESSHTLIAPVDKAICVLYLSDNTSVAEKLDAPTHLKGLSRTLLISHASIENQLAYVAAIMQASPLWSEIP